MTEIKTYKVNEGVNIHSFIDENFKTMRISVNMIVPLTEETAASYGILPAVVTHATKEYPDYTEFGKHLAELYGAHVDSGVTRIGSYQILTIAVGGIASKYAFDGEDMQKELSDILFSMLFTPLRDENGLFVKDAFEQEKRQILDTFDAEFNDKITYAREKARELYFAGKPESIHRYGKREDVSKLTREEVSGLWEQLISSAKFEIFILGNCEPDIALFKDKFANLGKNYNYTADATKLANSDTTTEEMKLSQSKLVMCYRIDATDINKAELRLMSTVLGGTPSSKFFVKVREEKHLCYYCSSRVDTLTNMMMIESGIETENINDAHDAILEQVEEMRKGNISDDELNSAKLAIINSLKSVRDSLHVTEAVYVAQCFDEGFETPEETVEKIEKISKEDIIKAANRLSLDTVFILKGIM